MTTVRELADKLGVSPQTVRRYVKKELGVATREREVLQLDAAQAAAVADHFSRTRTGKTTTEAATTPATPLQHVATTSATVLQHVATDVAGVATDVAGVATDVAGVATVSKDVAELIAQVARLEAERDAADARARQYRDEIDRLIEEHDKERADNAAARAQLAGALESAEAKARRAEAEASSYRPSIFGFYRKEEKPRLEG